MDGHRSDTENQSMTEASGYLFLVCNSIRYEPDSETSSFLYVPAKGSSDFLDSEPVVSIRCMFANGRTEIFNCMRRSIP